MTDDEREILVATNVVERFRSLMSFDDLQNNSLLQAIVRDKLATSIAEEREACAKLAESMDDGSYDYPPPRDVAAAIRGRK